MASRVLGFGEVPTTVLTSCYCDLIIDEGLWERVGRNGKRDRRVLAVVLLLLGGIAGGWISRSDGGMGVALWVGFALKVGIVVAWGVWRVEGEKEDGENRVEKG